jgi:SagB-type dehydrogenase family enzyme
MKHLLFILLVFNVCTTMSAQKLEPIKLNVPDKTRGSVVMKAFADRYSERNFSEKKLSLQDLSDLLWAACGINRPEKGMITAPSALNKQDVDVYAIMEEGAYLYDPKAHELKPVAAGDFRPFIASGQDFALKAPVSLLVVSELSRLGNANDEGTRLCGAIDGGIVSQNISLFCAGCGLATVPRGTMNKNELVKALKLNPTQLLVINHPVGYPGTSDDKNIFTFNLGQFKLSTLAEKMGPGNPKILIGATPELIQKYLPNGFQSQVNAFLLQTPGKNILIDAGLGRGDLLKNLESLHVKPEQINVILLTHMHGDHIGGLLADDKKVFPNADLYIAQPEYDYWMNSDNKLAHTILDTYKTRLKLFQPEALGSKKQNIFSGIQGIAAYGHTPGHTAYLLESGSSRLLVWGDLTHVTAVQLPHPELAVTYDTDAKQAIASRKKLMEFAAKNKIPVAGMHVASPAVGAIQAEGQGYVLSLTPAP